MSAPRFSLWFFMFLLFSAATPARGEITDAVLDSLRENPPRSVMGRLQAVETLLNVNQGELARQTLESVQQTQLNDDQLAALNERLGASYFLRLMREPALDPIGDQFAIQVFEAATRAARNPQHVGRLIDQLLVAGDDEAILIMDQLVSAGPAATGALIHALATRNVADPAVRQRLITAVGLGGSDAVPVVEAGIDAGDVAVAAAAIEASPRALERLSPRSMGNAQPLFRSAGICRTSTSHEADHPLRRPSA